MRRRTRHSSTRSISRDDGAGAGKLEPGPKPVEWTKAAEEILHPLAAYLAKISPAAGQKAHMNIEPRFQAQDT